MSQQLRRNLGIIAIVVVVLVVIAIIALWVALRNHASAPARLQAQTGNPVATVANDQLPAMFPADIPIEANAAITSNFNAAAANGQFQATRSFQSVKSVAANFALYQKFLTASTSTWTIVSSVNDPADPDHASIFAKDGAGLLTITMDALPPQPFPATAVSITYITNPPSAPVSAAPSAQK